MEGKSFPQSEEAMPLCLWVSTFNSVTDLIRQVQYRSRASSYAHAIPLRVARKRLRASSYFTARAEKQRTRIRM